jgi:hypothetical protein
MIASNRCGMGCPPCKIKKWGENSQRDGAELCGKLANLQLKEIDLSRGEST